MQGKEEYSTIKDCSLAGLNEECKMQIFSEYIEFGILIASIQKIKVRQKSTLFFFAILKKKFCKLVITKQFNCCLWEEHKNDQQAVVGFKHVFGTRLCSIS